MIQKFESVITAIKDLRKDISDHPTVQVGTRGIKPILSTSQLDTYFAARTRCLELLQSIPSQDARLRDTIEYVRDLEPSSWNTDELIQRMRQLQGDYAAGLISGFVTGGSNANVGFMIREALFVVENLGPPFPPAEIDRVGKYAILAVKYAFGEGSTQLAEISGLVNRRDLIVTTSGETTQEREQGRQDRWLRRRYAIINSLEVMLTEIRLNEAAAHNDERDPNTECKLASAQQRITLYENSFWFIAALIIGAASFWSLRSAGIYSHPNKLAIDFAISGIAACAVIFAARPKWRRFGGGAAVVFALILSFAALLVGVS